MSKPPVIAIVDDDEAVREALFDLLQSEDIAASAFDSAIALLAALEAGHFACIITDVRMPEMDGLELQQLLKKRQSTVPVIFVSSSTNEETRVLALREGAIAWFAKPVPEDALLALLRGLLGRRP